MNTKLELARVTDAKPLKEAAVVAFTSDFKEYGAFPPGIESMEWHRAEIEKVTTTKFNMMESWLAEFVLFHPGVGISR